jgi:cytochrome c2
LLVQCALATALVVLVPTVWASQRYGLSIWPPDKPLEYFVPLLGGACYLLSIAMVAWRARGRAANGHDVYYALTVALGLLFLAAVLLGPDSHRSVVLLTVASVTAAVVGVWLVPIRPRWKIAFMTLLLGALVGYHAQHAAGKNGVSQSSDTRLTGFYRLKIDAHTGLVPMPVRAGGGIEQLGDRLLLLTGDGGLLLLDPGPDAESIVARPLRVRVPVNVAAFERALEQLGLDSQTARAMDVHVDASGGRIQLFASHLYLHEERGCYTVRLSTLVADAAALESLPGDTPWRTVYESHPCLALDRSVNGERQLFDGSQSGGRIARLDPDTLLMTVGDLRHNGVSLPEIYPQDTNNSYGKIIAIDTRDWSERIYSLGHRNPQGLHVDAQGTVWSTEHGPRGGDELNREQPGGNFGWPHVTYGASYRDMNWPLNRTQGTHEGYLRPVFAWVPSIGISNLVRYRGNLFQHWRDDLLIGSLRDQSLWRVHVENDHAMVTERIEIGERVRDVLEAPSGAIYLWGDAGTFFVITPIEGETIATNSFDYCLACHAVKDGKSHGIGPDLFGVMGRDIASAPGYQYSAALRALDGDWSRARLDKFLENPSHFSPGTRMAVPGIADAGQRAALLDRLQTSR